MLPLVIYCLAYHFASNFRGIYDGGLELLNPFALLAGVVSLAMLVTHGANLLTVRTSDIIQHRCFIASRIFSLIFIIALLWDSGSPVAQWVIN